ncbi:hypothetical protein AUQ48_13775 [Kocuria flava]|uniref:Uncharacterized protein n=1 Tax=Kocuria flava TaxID=446860 RepID=A0A2N4T4G0_9MICC|nr:hypothetical protein AUQ48_13775 [Kocuria flava]
MAVATSGSTDPRAARSSAGTPRTSALTRFEYETTAPSKHAEAPGTSTTAAARAPPVRDSAVARVSPCRTASATSAPAGVSGRAGAVTVLPGRRGRRGAAAGP